MSTGGSRLEGLLGFIDEFARGVLRPVDMLADSLPGLGIDTDWCLLLARFWRLR